MSQTKWFKFENNPVLDVGVKGQWDDVAANADRVIRRDRQFLMWYAGFHRNFARIGYAISSDGINWTKHPSNPVLDVGQNEWDSVKAYYGYVLRSQSGYEMWYVGGSGVRVRIGLAESPDGVRWTKAKGMNPVIDYDTTRDWHRLGFASPSVIRQVGDVFKMWYHAIPTSGFGIQIGYAESVDRGKWKREAEPVVQLGAVGSWDEYRVGYPRVLCEGAVYDMWYSGSRETNASFRVGFATSRDGVHWTKSQENPVLGAGPLGSWDGAGVWTGDVWFDGAVYHMWYLGHDGTKGRTGYAVSPKGSAITVTPSNCYLPHGRAVHIAMRVADPSGISFSAKIKAPPRGVFYPGLLAQHELEEIQDLRLYDDGIHGDSAAGDGLFANTWVPKEENMYFLGLELQWRQSKHTLHFFLDSVATVTNVGPIQFDGLEFIGGREPTPGDTAYVKLRLRNYGVSGTPAAISASITGYDTLVTHIAGVSPWYGMIPAGAANSTAGYYQFVVSPQCPPNTNIRMHLSISSLGTSLWHDEFTIHVSSPWWRTRWAFACYILTVVACVVATARFVAIKKLRRKLAQLERDHALERERMRISQDMHDEVGARLTEIGILGELARRDIGDREKSEAEIQMITETSREVIASIGEIIWAINVRSDTLENLVAYVREYASKHLEIAGIECKFEIPEVMPDLQLSTEARRNIFLVIKETLHNIVKHSGAAVVNISMSFEANTLDILVEDNGKGFDTEHPSHFGNGLRNMEKRMDDIGGTFEILSTPGQGTKTTIRSRIGKIMS